MKSRCLALALLTMSLGCDDLAGLTGGDDASAQTTGEPKAESEQAMDEGSAPPPAAESSIPIEEVAKHPRPGTVTPSSLKFTPDGKKVTYLLSPTGNLTQDLFVHDLDGGGRKLLFTPPEGGTTESAISEEEKLRRERMRMRSLGVTRYAWAKDGDRFLVPLLGDVWVQDGLEGKFRKVIDTEGKPALDPQFSRDGEWIAYVVDAELHVVSAGGGEPQQLSRGARGTGKTHGLAEYIAQEEMGRHHGYWWSLDATRLAYTQVDERHIPAYRIEHQGKDKPHHEDHGYPFAGKANAKVKLGIVDRDGGKTQWLDLNATNVTDGGPRQDLYLARVHWMPDGTLIAEVENRDQSRLDLIRYDAKGSGSLVLTEKSDTWINLNGGFKVLDEVEGDLAGGFVWMSERTGFAHLYAYDASGKEVRALTEGDWLVDSVVSIDQAKGIVYFTGTKDGPTERHLYAVPLAGGEVRKLTDTPGMHSAVIDSTHTKFIDRWSSLETPPKITVRKIDDGSVITEIEIDSDPRVEELGLAPPELVSFEHDGTTLHGAIYKPDGDGPFPTVVSVYGGPHAQRVQNEWNATVDMRAQYLRSLGFLVFKLDNRGSARRGLAFEGALKHDMGNVEVKDQVAGVEWLSAQGLSDPDRVGIYGWSYGGYMSAMALARAPKTFKVAVAGAPVTHWDGYDTHYTERYMGTPEGNAEGYERSSVMAHLDGMEGKLMLVHGLIDENVHFRHTARLINAMIGANKRYDLLMFPNERHMPRREADLIYLERRIADFLRENL